MSGGRPKVGRGRRGEEMVPDAAPVSYYGLPVIKRPVWEARDIAGYLFLGGLAGGSSVVAASAALTGRPALARASKLGAASAIALSAAALVHDLGVPSRFANMLRTFKPTSPMSVGSWLLAAYGPAAAVAAASDLTGVAPGIGRAATVAAAGIGPAVAAYTGVLLADTAVPAWHEARADLPYLFVSSAAAAAAGWGLVWSPTAEAAPLRRLAAVAATAEVLVEHRMEQGLGLVGEPYAIGGAGRLLRWSRALTVAGGVGGALLGRRHRLAAVASGVALMAGSACTRFGVFEAGLISADDPRYTVTPQRARRDRR